MELKSDYRKYLDGVYWEKENNVSNAYMSLTELDTWKNQNKGEYIACIEGCLIDNLIISCKRGYAFCFEEYLNEWSSTYHVYFVPYKAENTKEYNALWDVWEELQEEVEKHA